MNETELLQEFRKERSEEAFAELVRRYANFVYSVAKRRLANATAAEDVTQMVFIRFAATPPTVQTHGELIAWLHRTTLNVAIDTWRSDTRRRNREQQAALMETNPHSDWEEISPHLDQAINQLENEDRAAILLRFFKQKSMRDIGAALGVSEGAAKMRVGRAIDRLRTQLGAGGIACTAAILGTVLTERSIEAAPAALVSRLAAMRLPEAAGAAAKGGMLHSLSRFSTFKLAAGAALLVSLCILLTRSHSSKSAPLQSVPEPAVEIASKTAEPIRRRTPLNNLNDSGASPTRATKILLHVLDSESGLGLSGTSVRYVFFGTGGQGERHDIVTDENGDARILEPDDPAKNSGPNVFVAAENHVPKAISFGSLPPAGEYTLKLDPALTAGGIIINEQGFSVPDVQIFITTPGNVPGQAENMDFQTCPVTNHDDGTWTCSYLPRNYTNTLHFILKKKGYTPTLSQVPLHEASLTNLILVIESGTTLSGKVTDQQGHPLANARLRLLNGDHDRQQSMRTDELGVFTLTGVQGQTPSSHDPPLYTNSNGAIIIRGTVGDDTMHVDIAVQADGFAPEMKTLELTSATNTVNFVLTSGHIFRGHLVDEDGNPISNAVVQTDYCFDGGSQRKFDWSAHTDANGAFEWDSAPEEETCYWFEANAGGYEIIRGRTLLADGSDHEIVLKRR